MTGARVDAAPSLNPQGEVLASMTRQKLDRGSKISVVLKDIVEGRQVHQGTVGEYRDAQNFHLTTEDGNDLPIPWTKIHHVESRVD